MKKSLLAVALVALAGWLFSAFIQPTEIPIGTPLPMESYKMKDVSGKDISLGEAKTGKGLLVIFSCNTCPYVKLSEKRIKEYTDYALANGIGCVLVNSNEAQRTEDDSFDEMVKYHKNQGLKCYYSVDEKSQLADAFGAGRTPQCFVFDKKGLIYKGAIDDNVKNVEAAKQHYLKEALMALVKNEKPATQESRSIGCTIKRLE